MILYKLSWSFCLLLSILTKTQSLPTNEDIQYSPNQIKLQSDFFEGDIILSSEQEQLLEYLKNHQKPKGRNALVDKRYLWPNGVILYRIDSGFSGIQLNVIKQAMSQIAKQTCLYFAEAPAAARAYVLIRTNNIASCNAAVGYQGYIQTVNLHADCVRVGTVIHELLHTIGLYHEQSASDRDRYIRIRYENVLVGKEHNFVKYPEGFVSNYGVGYDYDSIMHYGSKSFSRNGLDTIEQLQPGFVRIGQRMYLSAKDALKIRMMYRCSIN